MYQTARLLFAILTLLPGTTLAGTILSEDVNAVFANINDDGPGCAAGVIHQGEFVYKSGYGLANLEHEIPMSTQSVFRTGSVSKQFTAMAIAILVERGDIDLDADVHTYLPDLVGYERTVTVRQMIHHAAGMGDYDHPIFTKPDGSEIRFGNEDYLSNDEFYDLAIKADLVIEPGTEFLYSNLGYYLLGKVVERVSGHSLREFAVENIFGPLGMASSQFVDNVNLVVENRVDGYKQMDDGSWQIYMTNNSWVGDGGVFTTIDDFLSWDRNFYSNSLGAGKSSLIGLVETPLDGLVKQTSEGPVPTAYAFGMYIEELLDHKVIRHGGSWVGFSTRYARFPELELSVVVFCNSHELDAYEYSDKLSEVAVKAFAVSAKG